MKLLILKINQKFFVVESRKSETYPYDYYDRSGSGKTWRNFEYAMDYCSCKNLKVARKLAKKVYGYRYESVELIEEYPGEKK